MTPYRFSANTGYLWRERPFLERIRLAAGHGFQAVEFHDEGQREDLAALKAVLAETGLPVLGLNTRMGETLGCAAVPGQLEQAKDDILRAIELAEAIDAGAIHLVAGITEGRGDREAYLAALDFALAQSDRSILIEPVCREQVPGYHLYDIEEAARVLAEVGHPRLRMIFDCYHVYREAGGVLAVFQRHAASIGHVQIAAAEGRAEPLPGALDYGELLPAIQAAGYAGAFGCEYQPRGSTEAGLGWRDALLER